MCSEHFLPTDFVQESRDKTERRISKKESRLLTRRFLKPTAFPSVFKGLPSHYQKDVPAKRSTETSSSARRAKAIERQEIEAIDFLNADKVRRPAF